MLVDFLSFGVEKLSFFPFDTKPGPEKFVRSFWSILIHVAKCDTEYRHSMSVYSQNDFNKCFVKFSKIFADSKTPDFR